MLLFVFVARRPHTLSQNPYGVCPSRLGWAGVGWAVVFVTLKAFVCIVVVSVPRVFVPACFKKHASFYVVVFVVMTLVICVYGVILYFGFFYL